MDRILEPLLMEDDEQARAYAEADFEEPNSLFVSLFGEFFGHRDLRDYVVDLGCGPGDIPVRFARAYPHCIVHGVDGSAAMIRYGKKILAEAYDVRDRVKLILGVLPGAVLPRATYDVVISNSLLHHLSQPQVLWEAARHYAGPGAPAFIMDLKRPRSPREARELVETHSANEPEILKRDFYNSLLAAFEPDEIENQLKEAGLDHLSVKVVSDRHVVVVGYMP